MKNNNQKKPKNMIFIICGLFITGVILVFLIILLLVMKSNSKTTTQNKQHLNSKINTEQEQEIYNDIINKIEKEVDELTKQQEQNPSLKYSPKTTYYPGSKIIHRIEEYDQDTGNKIKETEYFENGNISIIEEYQKGYLKKLTFFNLDGTIQEVTNY